MIQSSFLCIGYSVSCKICSPSFFMVSLVLWKEEGERGRKRVEEDGIYWFGGMERRRQSLYSTRLEPIGLYFQTKKEKTLLIMLNMRHIWLWCKEILCLKIEPHNRLWHPFICGFILFLYFFFFNSKISIFIFFLLFLSNKLPLFLSIAHHLHSLNLLPFFPAKHIRNLTAWWP